MDEIASLMRQQKTLNWIIEVNERFCDYGIVGLLLAVKIESAVVLDTLLLSCRVLGRGVENMVLAELQNYCINHKLDSIIATFQPTSKNKPFMEFLRQTDWIANHKTKTYNYLIRYSDQKVAL